MSFLYLIVKIPFRLSNTVPSAVIERSRKSKLSRTRVEDEPATLLSGAPRDYKLVVKERFLVSYMDLWFS